MSFFSGMDDEIELIRERKAAASAMVKLEDARVKAAFAETVNAIVEATIETAKYLGERGVKPEQVEMRWTETFGKERRKRLGLGYQLTGFPFIAIVRSDGGFLSHPGPMWDTKTKPLDAISVLRSSPGPVAEICPRSGVTLNHLGEMHWATSGNDPERRSAVFLDVLRSGVRDLLAARLP